MVPFVSSSNEEDGVHATITLRVVCYLRILSPNDLAALRHKPEICYIDLYHSSLRHHAKIRVEMRTGVLLNPNDLEHVRRLQLWMHHVCVSVAQRRRSDEALVLGCFPREPKPHERSLRDDAFPLLSAPLSRP
eukprot:XP_001708682.1 Hypothetical protein GL50803_32323 [Giardia lamblia ATCC 50803]